MLPRVGLSVQHEQRQGEIIGICGSEFPDHSCIGIRSGLLGKPDLELEDSPVRPRLGSLVTEKVLNDL